jgi:Co/Zn/Cd efflux system component
MHRTVLSVPKMDCPAEAEAVRSVLGRLGITRIDVDIVRREAIVFHDAPVDDLLKAAAPLQFDVTVMQSEAGASLPSPSAADQDGAMSEARVLKTLLAINGFMFLTEMTVGLFSHSAGLIADSLDMLADAFVYALSLYAVGGAIARKQSVAGLSGYFQLALAVGVVIEVVRRFFAGSEPLAGAMVLVSALALAANVACMALLHAHKEGEVHMKASWIFSTNDVIANIGVIVAGGLVHATGSRFPDLVVGAVIAGVVLRGAMAIIRMSRGEASAS